MNAYHTNDQNIAKLRGLILSIHKLDVLKASVNNAIVKASIEDTIILATQASDAIDAIELSLSGMPSFQIKT